MYLGKGNAIKVGFSLCTPNAKADQVALLDSGATECFIHPEVAQQLEIPLQTMKQPKKVTNVDGTTNRAGEITKEVTMNVKLGETTKPIKFFVTDTGADDFIFGFSFLTIFNPTIDWTNPQVGPIQVSIRNQGGTAIGPTKPPPGWVQRLPGWEKGDEIWVRTIVRKTTVTQQLAEQATDKTKRTWQEIVPTQYHEFGQVFSEEASERFPERRPWDHAIDLREDAPMSIDCRVYPLSPAEKEVQKKFIATNLRLKRIRQSMSRYASGYFHIKKKDGTFRPVQDYRNLNKWTIPNKYPLPLITNLIHDLAGKTLFSKFDIRWGYNNVRIKEGDEWKAAFKTSEGLFEPTVMFFGLTNSPATF
jgi:hypothetical protein